MQHSSSPQSRTLSQKAAHSSIFFESCLSDGLAATPGTFSGSVMFAACSRGSSICFENSCYAAERNFKPWLSLYSVRLAEILVYIQCHAVGMGAARRGRVLVMRGRSANYQYLSSASQRNFRANYTLLDRHFTLART